MQVDGPGQKQDGSEKSVKAKRMAREVGVNQLRRRGAIEDVGSPEVKSNPSSCLLSVEG